MKPSQYNYYLNFGDQIVIYNGITESFFLVPKDRGEIYKQIISSPDEYSEEFYSFLNRMRNEGFIVDDTIDELQLVKDKYVRLTFPDEYYLMVLPTYQCNLRCWYCIQEHENLKMTDDVIRSLKRMINGKLSNDEIKRFHLSWFGGEPLIAYDIVLDLTHFGREVAKSKGKDFSSAITTNGTLLNPSRIEELREAGISHYQITIDGDRETHNKVKSLGGISAYDKTMRNIDLIARHTSVSLRFNYTADNLNPHSIVNDIRECISDESKRNIRFTIHKVWQENNDNINAEDVDRLFQISRDFSSELITAGLCYAERKHYDCVFPNGRVGKCDNLPPKDMPGIILRDGRIKWERNVDFIYVPHLFDGHQDECIKCRYLPICWGPCVAKREILLCKGKKIGCLYSDRDAVIHELLTNTVKNIKM